MNAWEEGPALSEDPSRRGRHRPGALMGAAALAVFGVWSLSATLFGTRTVTMGLEGEGLDGEARVENLRRMNRALETELHLAEAGEPYILLDAPGRVLVLKSHGAVLRKFPVLEARVRVTRTPRRGRMAETALDTVWVQGALLPERKKERMVTLSDTVSEPDLSASVAYIPPTPEEEYPTPPAFRIRCSGGVSVLVRPERPSAPSEEESRPALSLPAKMAQWLRLRPWAPGFMRVELTMTEEEAGALYRAYTDGTPLVVSTTNGS